MSEGIRCHRLPVTQQWPSDSFKDGDFEWRRSQTLAIKVPGEPAAIEIDTLSDDWTWDGNWDSPTIRPSIDTGRFHGWLTDGWLEIVPPLGEDASS